MKKIKTHIGAYGIITNDNKIVLIKKARGGYTGKLDLPGGGIEHNESPTEALIRELKEETGSTVITYNLLDVIDANITWEMAKDLYEDLHHIGVIYIVTIKDNIISELPDGIDSLGATWYDIDSLKEEELTPFANYSIKYLKKKKHWHTNRFML